MNRSLRHQTGFLFAVILTASSAFAATAPPLGQAGSFAVLGGVQVANTGPSRLFGDLGVFPGSSIIGFPPGQVIGGATHLSDAVAQQAQTDTTAAYVNLAGQPTTADLSGIDLGGLSPVPGAYRFTSAAQLTGTLTLNGPAGSVWVFQIGSALTTASGSRVVVTGGASPCNVFWQVGSSAVLNTTTVFAGNILALTDISLRTGATVNGRVLARNGTVTLDSNDITSCAAVCPAITVSPGTVPAGTVSTAYTQSFSASGGAGPYNFSVTAGALPPGLSLTSGTLSGTPTTAGTFAFTITASDSTGCTGSQAYSLLVNPSGGALGDPHMHTLDGLAYDFQSCGEFVLLRTGTSDLEVQTRQELWLDTPTTVSTQIAVKVAGHVISVDLTSPSCAARTSTDIGGCAKVDNRAVAFRCEGGDQYAGCLKVFALPGLGYLEEHIAGVSEGKSSRRFDSACDVSQGNCSAMPSDAPCTAAITLRLFTGEVIEACLAGGSYINVRTDLPLAVSGLTSGLLGDADGDPLNDLMPQGGVIALPMNASYEQFYGTYSNSWRVAPESSLLTAPTGPARACANSVFQLSDLSPAQLSHATQVCLDLGVNAGNLDACMTDVALIGDSSAYGYVGLAPPRAKVTLTGAFVPGMGDGRHTSLGENAFGTERVPGDLAPGSNAAVGCGCGSSASGPSAFLFAVLALALVAMSRRRPARGCAA